MPAVGRAAPDFRTAAIAASQARLAGLRAQGVNIDDPLSVGVSYCLPAPGDGPAVLARVRRVLVICMALGFVLLVAAVGLGLNSGVPLSRRGNFDSVNWTIAGGAGVCAFFGLMAFIGGAIYQKRVSLGKVTERVPPLKGRGQPRVRTITIEDPATYRRAKLVAEDIGALICYPESRCAQIEGVCYQYLVYGPDVVQLEVAQAVVTKTVLLGFRIGGHTLTLAIFAQDASAELKRELNMSVTGHPLLDELIRTLRPGVEDSDAVPVEPLKAEPS